MKKKISVYVTDDQAHRFSAYAEADNRTRSEFMVEAAEQMINRYGKKKEESLRKGVELLMREVLKLSKMVGK